jgi:hypothetical protein
VNSITGVMVSVPVSDLIVKKSKLTNIFKMKVKTSDNMSECRGSKTVKPKKECAFDKNLTKLFSNHSDIILKRYLQSYYYFDKYKEEIREQFVGTKITPHNINTQKKEFVHSLNY